MPVRYGAANFVLAGAYMPSILPMNVERLIQSISIVIVEDNLFMRKVFRTLLTNLGIKAIHEAADGAAGLEAIRAHAPDIVLLDWEMPVLNGLEVVRTVRKPGDFPLPDVPIIMLSAHGERWRVVEAARAGVHEFLKKPVSGKVLLDRMVAILTTPRPMVTLGDYYGPEPRNVFCEPVKAPTDRPPVVMPA